MSGFIRGNQPAALGREGVKAAVTRFLAIEIAEANAGRDPFGLDDPCPVNPAGHQFIGSCSDVVCCHCSKVAWQ